jgi:hypothetical protein
MQAFSSIISKKNPDFLVENRHFPTFQKAAEKRSRPCEICKKAHNKAESSLNIQRAFRFVFPVSV